MKVALKFASRRLNLNIIAPRKAGSVRLDRPLAPDQKARAHTFAGTDSLLSNGQRPPMSPRHLVKTVGV